MLPDTVSSVLRSTLEKAEAAAGKSGFAVWSCGLVVLEIVPVIGANEEE
jgi:hypothetical protein